jgi:predicted RNA-binding Zn ribbon-like protein
MPPVAAPHERWTFDRCAGHPALDFANTVSDRASAPVERLLDYFRLLDFARQAELIGPAAARRLEAEAKKHPGSAAKALGEAIELREALHAIFTAVASGRAPSQPDLDVLAERHGRFRLDPCLEWRWSAGPDALDSPVAPIVRSAVDLLLSDKCGVVKLCEKESCRWLFFDSSKNHSRRWCDMKNCGNLEKARRFRQRR